MNIEKCRTVGCNKPKHHRGSSLCYKCFEAWCELAPGLNWDIEFFCNRMIKESIEAWK